MTNKHFKNGFMNICLFFFLTTIRYLNKTKCYREKRIVFFNGKLDQFAFNAEISNRIVKFNLTEIKKTHLSGEAGSQFIQCLHFSRSLLY